MRARTQAGALALRRPSTGHTATVARCPALSLTELSGAEGRTGRPSRAKMTILCSSMLQQGVVRTGA